MKNKLESAIQREVCDYLASIKLDGLLFWRSNNVSVFAKSNDGKFRFRALPKYTPKGIPDIIIVYRGRFIGFEIKREGAKLRTEQADFAVKVALAGGLYYVVHSVDEAKKIIEEDIADIDVMKPE